MMICLSSLLCFCFCVSRFLFLQAVAAASSQHVRSGGEGEGDAEKDAAQGSSETAEVAEEKAEKEEGEEKEEGNQKEESEEKEEVKEDKEIEELRSRVNFYQAAVQFVMTIHKAVSIIESLLRSTTTSDVVEAMHFLVGVYPFQMEVAQQSTRKMLLLVWSKENAIAESVVEAYHTIFLAPLQAEESKEMCAFTAQRLCELARGATVGELTSLEKVMQQLAVSKQLPSSLLLALWDLMEKQCSMEAASLLSLCAGAASKVLWPKLKALLRTSTLRTMQSLPVLARCVSLIAQRLVNPNEGAAAADESDCKLLTKFLVAVVMHEGGGKDDRWLPAAEQSLNALVKIHPHPHSVFAAIVRGTARQV